VEIEDKMHEWSELLSASCECHTIFSSCNMSLSDNSTIAYSSDIDGSFQSTDEPAEAHQSNVDIGITKKGRRARRLLRSTAATTGADGLSGPGLLKEDYNDAPDGDVVRDTHEKS